jgi:phosphoadenosine phosphosulfate reductase
MPLPENLVYAVRKEVEKPFSEKLKRSLQLVKMHGKSNAVISCSFGKDSIIVLDIALEYYPKIPVVYENTYIDFPETAILKRKILKEWELNFYELFPAKGVTFWTVNDRIIAEHLNMDDGRKHSNLCCYYLKDKPFNIWRKTNGISRSITGITAVESRNRMFTACEKGMEYYNHKYGYWKINPITYWTEKEVWEYTHDHNLPVNEAYKKYNLDRVGCMWCMSHQKWRPQVARINSCIYCYMMRRYFGTPSIQDQAF